MSLRGWLLYLVASCVCHGGAISDGSRRDSESRALTAPLFTGEREVPFPRDGAGHLRTLVSLLAGLGVAVLISAVPRVRSTEEQYIAVQEPATNMALQYMRSPAVRRLPQPTRPSRASFWQPLEPARHRPFLQPSASAANDDTAAASTPTEAAADAAAASGAGATGTTGTKPMTAADAIDGVAGKRRMKVDSTDAVATFLTRRFGLKGGLAWLGLLTFGVVAEQAKTRWETWSAATNTVDLNNEPEMKTPSGLRYTDLKRGGGDFPRAGDFVAYEATVKLNDEVIFNTKKSGRQIAFVFGKGTGLTTIGVQEGISSMRQGGKRILIVPPDLAFGSKGTELKSGVAIPPDATLTYEIELTRVSIAPS